MWQPGANREAGRGHANHLSVDDAAEITAAVVARFPNIQKPKQQDICYATQNRQDAVKLMSPQVDIVIVVGSPTSSNSNRLAELRASWAWPVTWSTMPMSCKAPGSKAQSRGLTAGASAPEILVRQVIDRIRALGAFPVQRWTALRRPSSSRCPRVCASKSPGILECYKIW